MHKLAFLSVLLPTIELIVARPQQPQVEPAYLRDFYTRGHVSDATPIFETGAGGFQPSSGQGEPIQQIRLRDSVQEQVGARTACPARGRAKWSATNRVVT